METLWRLAWALPLVLAVGVVIMLALKRIIAPMPMTGDAARRMNLRESLALSDDTRAHLIEVDGKAWLVVESTRQAVLQSSESVRAPVRVGPPWMQRFYRSGPR